MSTPLPLPPAWSPIIDDWVASLEFDGLTTESCRTRRDHIQRFARSHHEVTISDILPCHVQKFCTSREWSNEYRRSFYASLKKFFSWAYQHGHTENDLAASLPKVAIKENVRPPADEQAYMDAWVDAGPRELVMLMLAGELGLRRGEIAKVHENDMVAALDGWSLLVHGKGGSKRLLPLTSSLAQAIWIRLDEVGGGYLFPGKIDGHLSAQRVGNLISRLLPQGVTTHQLRHRFAVTLYRETKNVRAVQAFLGHKSLNTTQIYLHQTSNELREFLYEASNALRPKFHEITSTTRPRYTQPTLSY